jgi:hypothetical protein
MSNVTLDIEGPTLGHIGVARIQMVRLSDCPGPTVCLLLAAGLPARAPRALVLSEWEAGVSIRARKKKIPRGTDSDIPIHTHRHTVTNNVWNITINTRFGTSSHN